MPGCSVACRLTRSVEGLVLVLLKLLRGHGVMKKNNKLVSTATISDGWVVGHPGAPIPIAWSEGRRSLPSGPVPQPQPCRIFRLAVGFLGTGRVVRVLGSGSRLKRPQWHPNTRLTVMKHASRHLEARASTACRSRCYQAPAAALCKHGHDNARVCD